MIGYILIILLLNNNFHLQQHIINDFNKDQNRVINECIDIFDNYLIKIDGNKEISTVYKNFFFSFDQLDNLDSIHKEIYKNDSIFDVVVQLLMDAQVLNEIWTVNIAYDQTGNKFSVLNYNIKGKYWLSQRTNLSSINFFKDYIYYVEDFGGIVPGLVSGYSSCRYKVDFNNRRIRLFSLIHLITASKNNPSSLNKIE
jgi:hypothetical protein